MDLLRPFVVASAVTLTLVGAGQGTSLAADPATLPPPSTLSPRVWSPEYAPRNVFLSDLYVRADIGERWGSLTGADAAPGFTNPTDNKLGSAASLNIGVGFRRNWIRADLTVDYVLPQKYEGTVVTPGDVAAKIQASTALCNLYADLGTWYRLTPYIGAGIGAAQVDVYDFESAVSPPFSGSGNNVQWKLAWAAMAGTAFAISRNLQIDAGYRYLSFGDVQSGVGPGGSMNFKNVTNQEVRVGLRWNLDDLSGIR
jgi:opacity protein-like surface antigen